MMMTKSQKDFAACSRLGICYNDFICVHVTNCLLLYSIEKSCYINSAVQFLFTSQAFCTASSHEKGSALLDCFKHIIEAVQANLKSELDDAVRTFRIRFGLLLAKPEVLDINQQNDSIEIVRGTLQQIHTELVQLDLFSNFLRKETIVESNFMWRSIASRRCSRLI
jgi:hypothetical protein